MSLYEAAYQTSNVPYREADYWCDITEPTTKLVEFMAEITRLLAGASVAGELPLSEGNRLFHLDQGMGGGKSHALVGLWHMAAHRGAFFASEVGQQVLAVARQRAGAALDPGEVHPVVLCADNFSPGAARPEFGPATNLHQRFLWALFGGDRSLYDAHVGAGTDKAAVKDTIRAAGRPVLILLDEIMDYAMVLAGPDHRDTIPSEQAFLSALTGAVAETENAVLVVVMIRSDLDEQGYEGAAQEFREYVGRRLERNGTTVSVNEPQDFGAIIRRRIFSRPAGELPVTALADRWVGQASTAWREHVFDRLPGARQLGGFAERLARSYPFHPDLLDLVEHDWTQHAGFQRVRSTVEVFSATGYWWVSEREAGRWVPELMGVGDIPLHRAADQVLSSGVLHGNDRQVVGMRQVAEKDVTSADRSDGQAVQVDRRLTDGRPWVGVQPQPAVRLATALWLYSVAARAQGKRGATKAELLAAIYVPDESFGFGEAEEVFNALTDDEDERALGALDVIQGGGGSVPNRFVLSTQLNKRMFQRAALNRATPELYNELVWDRAQKLASSGSGFDAIFCIERPTDESTSLKDVFHDIDQRRSNRLVVLDPRRWTLLNGRDGPTRDDVEAVFGLGPDRLAVDFAASCVVACVNTQRRDAVSKHAKAALSWQLALGDVDPEAEMHGEMATEAKKAMGQLDEEIRRAFQHFAYLVRDGGNLRVEFAKIESDERSALSGNDVWEALAARHEAVPSAGALAGGYLHRLLDLSVRPYALAEVVESFWRDPIFPLVPNDTVIKRAIFDALRPDEDGVAWELVTSAGERLAITSPEQLAILSRDQLLRRAEPEPDTGVPTPGPGSEPSGETSGRAGPTGGSETGGRATRYVVHEIELRNRSLTDREARSALWQLLAQVADVIDPTSGSDVQVATIRMELNAAAGALDDVATKARDAGASWAEREEDF